MLVPATEIHREKDGNVRHCLDIGAALLAFVAATLWFISAYGKLPPMVAYYGPVPENDPFRRAVIFSAQMNRWAALFSGLSALCLGAELFTR
jgi:hypothetical protein